MHSHDTHNEMLISIACYINDSIAKRLLFVQIKGVKMYDLIGGLMQQPHCSEANVMFW